MRVIIEPTNEQGSAWAAAHIARRINEHAKSTDRPFVLGDGLACCRIADFLEKEVQV